MRGVLFITLFTMSSVKADSQTIDDIKGINMKFQEVMSKMGQIDKRITQMSQRDTKILSGIETIMKHLSYEIVDGGFSEWSSWSSCQVTCGEGMKSRTRTCTQPPPKYGGKICAGDYSETAACTSARKCPIDGGFSQWTTWSECSVYCGEGTITRTRSCTQPIPAHGGRDCVGANSENKTCVNAQNPKCDYEVVAEFEGTCRKANGDWKGMKGRIIDSYEPDPAKCLRRCMKESDATGCSHNNWVYICYLETGEVSKGSGQKGGKCWKLSLKKGARNVE